MSFNDKTIQLQLHNFYVLGKLFEAINSFHLWAISASVGQCIIIVITIALWG